jgi:hypothetical protein
LRCRQVQKECLPFLATLAAPGILWPDPGAFAQSSPAPSNVLPTGGRQGLIDPSDSGMLLLDHQSGLFQTVKDIGIVELRNNTIMLAKLAKLYAPVAPTYAAARGRQTTGTGGAVACLGRKHLHGLADRRNAALPRSQYQSGRAIAATAICSTEEDRGHEHRHDQG